MLEGVLEDFLDKLNLHIEPLKEHIINLDRFFLLFLVIGFISTVIMAIVFGQLYDITISVVLGIFYIGVVGLMIYRNNRLQKIY